MKKRISKIERQQKLQDLLNENPFTTDEELAHKYNCSIQTIRLDRLEMGIPELRERMKRVAENNYSKVKSVTDTEIVGELVELELGKRATSIMEVTPEMVAEKSNVCRGHNIFSQANMLAVALIDSEVVLTGSARVRYRRPVYLNEKLIATAYMKRKHSNKYLVKVISRVGAEEVFEGKFIVVSR